MLVPRNLTTCGKAVIGGENDGERQGKAGKGQQKAGNGQRKAEKGSEGQAKDSGRQGKAGKGQGRAVTGHRNAVKGRERTAKGRERQGRARKGRRTAVKGRELKGRKCSGRRRVVMCSLRHMSCVSWKRTVFTLPIMWPKFGLMSPAQTFCERPFSSRECRVPRRSDEPRTVSLPWPLSVLAGAKQFCAELSLDVLLPALYSREK